MAIVRYLADNPEIYGERSGEGPRVEKAAPVDHSKIQNILEDAVSKLESSPLAQQVWLRQSEANTE